MIIQEIRTIDELLQFMNGLYKRHGSRLWYRGEENASLTAENDYLKNLQALVLEDERRQRKKRR